MFSIHQATDRVSLDETAMSFYTLGIANIFYSIIMLGLALRLFGKTRSGFMDSRKIPFPRKFVTALFSITVFALVFAEGMMILLRIINATLMP